MCISHVLMRSGPPIFAPGDVVCRRSSTCGRRAHAVVEVPPHLEGPRARQSRLDGIGQIEVRPAVDVNAFGWMSRFIVVASGSVHPCSVLDP
jgi:hypothetical protein